MLDRAEREKIKQEELDHIFDAQTIYGEKHHYNESRRRKLSSVFNNPEDEEDPNYSHHEYSSKPSSHKPEYEISSKIRDVLDEYDGIVFDKQELRMVEQAALKRRVVDGEQEKCPLVVKVDSGSGSRITSSESSKSGSRMSRRRKKKGKNKMTESKLGVFVKYNKKGALAFAKNMINFKKTK